MHNQLFILRWVSTLNRYTESYFNKRLLANYGIGGSQVKLLIFLLHHEGVNQEEIAETFCQDKSSIGRSLKKLESLEYISRKRKSDDHRNLEIRLTEKAVKLAPELLSVLDDWLKIITGTLPEEKQKVASELLREMVENAKKELKSQQEK
jgi:DNA-binding MarR family transcriptional regulator